MLPHDYAYQSSVCGAPVPGAEVHRCVSLSPGAQRLAATRHEPGSVDRRRPNWGEGMPEGWTWDETLYAGSAPYYALGRLPYAPGLANVLATALDLDGRGRMLDVGCGPGILSLRFAHLFPEVIGVDPDPGMLAEARQRARLLGIANVRWLQTRAEELTPDLGRFRLITFGQSFHWLEREQVAANLPPLLEPDGAVAHISDWKEPVAQPENLPFPLPPYEAIRVLIRHFLGPVPRAGQGFLPHGSASGEAAVCHAAGFTLQERKRVPAAGPRTRTIDDLVAWVFSLSGAAPHLFGERRAIFEVELRRLLNHASPSGQFSEQPPDTDVQLFRLPPR